MKPILLFPLLALIFYSCGNNRNNVEDFESLLSSIESDSTLHVFLDGNWNGYYEQLEYKIDTIFYESYEETPEYILTNTVTDSSLIKDAEIRIDTTLKPITLYFNILDSLSKTVVISTEQVSDTFEFQTGYSFTNYKESPKKLLFSRTTLEEDSNERFSEIHTSMLSNVSTANAINDSLSWDKIDLIIETMNRDSISLVNAYGEGRIFLKKTGDIM